jgi:hypothetical protein
MNRQIKANQIFKICDCRNKACQLITQPEISKIYKEKWRANDPTLKKANYKQMKQPQPF